MIVVMGVIFKIAQPSTPIFRYNGSIFSVSNDVYKVSSKQNISVEQEIRVLDLIGKTIDKKSLKYFYKFNPKKEFESYMVASFSEIYGINDKPLRGKLSDTLLVKFDYDVTYKGKVYEKGKYYIANRTAKYSDYTVSQ